MPGFLPQVVQNSLTLVTSQGPLMHAMGMNMFRTFAVGRIVYEGFRIAYRDAPATGFSRILLLIGITYAGLVCYSAPFPTVGKGLTAIVTDAGQDLAAMIDTQIQEDIGKKLADAIGAQSGTSWNVVANMTAMFRFFILESALAVMQAAILGVIAVAYIFVGILVMVGPIFLPFLIVPGFEHFAVNWFNCLVQYSFYPVVANAFVFVFAHVWLDYLNTITFPMDSETIAANLTVIVTFAFAGVYGLFKIPQFNSHLFSGSSGIGGWR